MESAIANPGPTVFRGFWHGAELSPHHILCLNSFLARGCRVEVFSYEPKRRKGNPILWWMVSDLKHPGYPERGKTLTQDIVGDRYVDHASGFSHFFLCPTVYEVELSRYVECACAGCVPIGQAPTSLHPSIDQYLVPSTGQARELVRTLTKDGAELRERAAGYRSLMRTLRDPAKLASDLEDQIRRFV